MFCRRLLVSVLLSAPIAFAQSSSVRLADVYPDKARYAPSEPIHLVVETTGSPRGESIRGTLYRLGGRVGDCAAVPLTSSTQSFSCTAPATDFQGYLVEVELLGKSAKIIAHRTTALDISSNWKRFPRYGYLAHYSAGEGTHPAEWIADLNKYHINGLEFYDFQYRHDHPLAGTVDHPLDAWKDIAGRPVDGHLVRELIDQAHDHNMMAMAYNASYSAYDDVFTRKDPLPLEWATWNSPNGPRTAATAKRFDLHADHWSTESLFYMNQNSHGWQDYLFARMKELLDVYKFDGWHVDTFGEKGGYAFDRSYIDYVHGFPEFINRAHHALNKPIVFNAVNTFGQTGIARSDAEFVYSELWEDHETFSSLLTTADEVRLANPRDGIVFAAYLHRLDTKEREVRPPATFNPSSVLLTDAVLFASGASHIELGDGDRMLSSEYFPADAKLTLNDDLRTSLRRYYDFLTAYENDLRDEPQPDTTTAVIVGHPSSSMGTPSTVWIIARETPDGQALHLINLLGSDDPHWRDKDIDRPKPPRLENITLQIKSPDIIAKVGWASPEVDAGKYHELPVKRDRDSITVQLPELNLWDVVFLSK